MNRNNSTEQYFNNQQPNNHSINTYTSPNQQHQYVKSQSINPMVPVPINNTLQRQPIYYQPQQHINHYPQRSMQQQQQPINIVETLINCIESGRITEENLIMCDRIIENYSKECLNTLSTQGDNHKALMTLLEKMSQSPELYTKDDMIEIKEVIKKNMKDIKKMVELMNSDIQTHKNLKTMRAQIIDRYASIEQFNKDNGLLDRITDARDILKKGQIERKKKYVRECLKMIGVTVD